MDILKNKIITQALLPMDVFNPLEVKVQTCAKHGVYTAQRFHWGWSACAQCRDERHRDECARQQRKRLAQQREAMILRLFGRAGIPRRFHGRTLGNFAVEQEGQERVLAVAADYVAHFPHRLREGTSLIFCGAAGTGKTHLATGIANAVMQQGYSAVFTSVMAAVRCVKETYSRYSERTEREVIEHFVNPDLLILDEVGVQFGSDTEKLILFEMINRRYEDIRPTLVISNLAKEALTEALGERAFDRLRENGGRLLVFDWESYRKRIKPDACDESAKGPPDAV